MGIMNGLTFGGINSLDYGIYISGEAVFNAPARDVEMLQIPGRNGDLVLDHGRFENVEVSYPAGTFGDDQTDFREKLSDFRNAILSQVGYQRLTDSYHPDEYRMGVYASGLEVSPVHYNTAGEFVLTFNCKPQRWLTSGEDSVAIADGGTLDNPTLFAASPLLEIDGYGDIGIGDNTIVVDNVVLGEIIVYKSEIIPMPIWSGENIVVDTQFANPGDIITLAQTTDVEEWSNDYGWAQSVVIVSYSGDGGAYGSVKANHEAEVSLYLNKCAFVFGTASYKEVTATYNVVTSGPTFQGTLTFRASYDGANTIKLKATRTLAQELDGDSDYYNVGDIVLDSTQVVAPIYIDLDIGEAYTEKNGSYASVNNAVKLPTKLPTLQSGSTTITYDNTFTSFKVVPRWWKV